MIYLDMIYHEEHSIAVTTIDCGGRWRRPPEKQKSTYGNRKTTTLVSKACIVVVVAAAVLARSSAQAFSVNNILRPATSRNTRACRYNGIGCSFGRLQQQHKRENQKLLPYLSKEPYHLGYHSYPPPVKSNETLNVQRKGMNSSSAVLTSKTTTSTSPQPGKHSKAGGTNHGHPLKLLPDEHVARLFNVDADQALDQKRSESAPRIGSFYSDLAGVRTTSFATDQYFLEDFTLNETVPSNATNITISTSAPTRLFLEERTGGKQKKTTQPQNLFAFAEPRKANGVTANKARSRPRLLEGRNPDEVITVADLNAILKDNDFARKVDVMEQERRTGNKLKEVKKEQQQSSKGGVAFPQPLVLSYDSIKWGASVSAAAMGMIVAASASPTLWLMGALAGGLFGYETGKSFAREPHDDPSSVLPGLVITSGRLLAKAAFKVYDGLNTFFFMYKTGQLSYEYYKRYASLDNRFGIQEKLDAWNARFVEGKLAFDKWEKSNEIGRKALAGIRTAFLIGEQNSKRRSEMLRRNQHHQSDYRIIQLIYDVTYAIGRLFGFVWELVVGGNGNRSREFREFLSGIFGKGIGSTAQARIRGVAAALVMVHLIGALFTISSTFLALLAAALGWIWPSWVPELFERVRVLIEETQERGRDGKSASLRNLSRKRAPAQSYYKNRYSFFLSQSGKKRYYRVGQPWFSASQSELTRKKPRRGFILPSLDSTRQKKPNSGFLWPWST